jgi:NhaP-type Na+/H+ or K+/H+ antiporter
MGILRSGGKTNMDAAVAALCGAAIGALTTVAGTWLSQRHQTRRERLKIAVDLGIADHAYFMADAKAKGGLLPPVALYVAYHADMLDAIHAGTFDAEAVARIEARQLELIKALPNRF